MTETSGLYVIYENGYTNVMARTANGKPFTVLRVEDALIDRCDFVFGLEYRLDPRMPTDIRMNNFTGVQVTVDSERRSEEKDAVEG